MKKTERKPLSMFSQETLDSLEMAEILGGDDNKNCRNNNCSNEKDCTDTKCENGSCENHCTLVSGTTTSTDTTKLKDNTTDEVCSRNDYCVFEDGEWHPIKQDK